MTFLVWLSRVDRSAYRFWLFGDKNFDRWFLVGFDNIVFVGRRVRRWYASVLGCLWWVFTLHRSKVILKLQKSYCRLGAYCMRMLIAWNQNFRLSLYKASLLRFTSNKMIKIRVATGITISKPFISFSFR